MKIGSQRMILGSNALHIAVSATDRRHAQPACVALGPGKEAVPQPYDQFIDLESARLMEERYGIKEEGLF